MEDSVTTNETRLSTLLKHHGLQAWWLECFSANERAIIHDQFAAAVRGKLLPGFGTHLYGDNASALLVMLVGVVNSAGHRTVVERLAEKAIAVARKDSKVMDLHFAYLHLIMAYARERHTSREAQERMEAACRAQISLAPTMARIFGYPMMQLPPHLGYQMLSTLLEEEGRFKEALEVARTARNMGWYGDWDACIGRCLARLASVRIQNTSAERP